MIRRSFPNHACSGSIHFDDEHGERVTVTFRGYGAERGARLLQHLASALLGDENVSYEFDPASGRPELN